MSASSVCELRDLWQATYASRFLATPGMQIKCADDIKFITQTRSSKRTSRTSSHGKGLKPCVRVSAARDVGDTSAEKDGNWQWLLVPDIHAAWTWWNILFNICCNWVWAVTQICDTFFVKRSSLWTVTASSACLFGACNEVVGYVTVACH
jgi:hypothetical protein